LEQAATSDAQNPDISTCDHQEEQDVEEPAGREEEPSSERLRSTRRLEFETLTTTTTTGDGGSGGGGGGDDDDDDDGGHDDGGPSSGLRKPYQRGPSTLPARRPLPHQRTVITPVAKT
jgi:hypothetical protein